MTQPKIIRKTVVRRKTLGGKIKRAAALSLFGAGAYLLARRAVRGVADLRGQVVLIAGGSRGLGLLLARHFAAAGCKIAICARGEDELRRAHDELQKGNVEIFTQVCDVTVPGEVEKLVKDVVAHYGQIDILVNNAAILQVGPMASMTRDDFEITMDVAFWGTYNATQAVLPAMRKRKSGRIVNIVSIAGEISMPHLMPYNCAKSAVLGFSRSLRIETARDGIKVTSVLPGLMRTGSILGVSAKGNARVEGAMFGVMGSLPGLTLRAEDAARRIVNAVRLGESEIVVGAPYGLLARVQGLFPGAVSDVLSVANRVMPGAPDEGESESKTGREVFAEIDSPLLNAVLKPNLEAAQRLNQNK